MPVRRYNPNAESEAIMSRFRSATPPREDKRPPASKRGYGWRWKQVSDGEYAKHPICARCGKLILYRREVRIDHAEPVAVNPNRKLDRSNCQTLCIECHARKTIADYQKYPATYGKQT